MLTSALSLILLILPLQNPTPVYSVPFEILPTRHTAVQVMVNGKGPFRLIFDTGAPTTIVTTRLAREVGLLEPAAQNAPTLFGMRPRVAVESIALGEAVARNLRVDVLDHPTVEMIEEVSGRLDGIVGLSVFGRFRTTIDYQASRLTLEPIGFEPPDVLASVMNRLMTRTQRQVVAPRGLWGLVLDGGQAGGAKVASVLPGSPAARAGIVAGDVIVLLDRRWVENVQDCFEAASLVRGGGGAVPVTVVRAGKQMSLRLTPAEGL